MVQGVQDSHFNKDPGQCAGKYLLNILQREWISILLESDRWLSGWQKRWLWSTKGMEAHTNILAKGSLPLERKECP